jgi:hypothetical protein
LILSITSITLNRFFCVCSTIISSISVLIWSLGNGIRVYDRVNLVWSDRFPNFWRPHELVMAVVIWSIIQTSCFFLSFGNESL